MADTDLTDRVRKLFARARSLNQKRMFGGTAFMLRGHICVTARFVDCWSFRRRTNFLRVRLPNGGSSL